MRKAAILAIFLTGVCLFTACGSRSAESSDSASAESMADESVQGEMETVTLPVMTKKVPERKITALTFVNSSDEPLVLDIDEKRGSFAARAEFEGIITSGQIEIYAEDETMVEVSDITVKDNGLINFYLIGKRAGNSELYIATTDGTLVSEPMAFEVRSAEEKAYAERPVYYNMLGDYWHYSKECAEADGPDTAYTWDGEEIPADRFDRPVFETTRDFVFGDTTPCPKCAAEEAAQQDGE